MSSIPASQFVQIIPGVLSAGGQGLQNNGVFLTNNPRAPTNSVLGFGSAANVSTYFGASSTEARMAGGGTNFGSGYFGGFNNAQALPQSMLFAQFNPSAVSAWIRGGPVSGLTIPQLQAISGSLAIVMDGYTYTAASINLSGASSPSAAAALIQTGLNASLPAEASVTAAIAPATSTFTGSISGNVLTVFSAPSTPLVAGAVLAGSGVAVGTQIDGQLSGAAGGVGTYAVSVAQVVPNESMTATWGVLNVTVVASGTLAVGQTVAGGTTAAGTQITALGTGTGLTGTYIVNLTQTVTSGALTTSGSALAVAYDSVSGAFQINSGSRGAQSSAAFATGTIAASLALTQATGAQLSQGAAPQTPAACMTALTNLTQNWVSFTHVTDPDGGPTGGNLQKQAFAAWTNGQNNRYAYVVVDQDPSPSLSAAATSSLGYILGQSQSSGTILVWSTGGDGNYAAFVMGMIASINFSATNGRITLAFKGQTGLVATVTNQTVYQNLVANGYNCYCAFATAAQQFVDFQPGNCSGPFQWADSYVDQIVLNQALQLALVLLLTQVNSIPYNSAGYAMIESAMMDPIEMGLNAGIIRTGVVLSNQQASLINNQSNQQVAQLLQQQGYLVVIQAASPQVRQARGSPVITLWYTDGQSVQKIVLQSILVQ
jgi:hypothetical protein